MIKKEIVWIGGYPRQEGINIPGERQAIVDADSGAVDQSVDQVLDTPETPMSMTALDSSDLRSGRRSKASTGEVGDYFED